MTWTGGCDGGAGRKKHSGTLSLETNEAVGKGQVPKWLVPGLATVGSQTENLKSFVSLQENNWTCHALLEQVIIYILIYTHIYI